MPLLLGEDGQRLAKRDGLMTVAGLREAGFSAEAVIGLLAKFSGLGDGAPTTASSLLDGFSLQRIATAPTVVRGIENHR